MHHVCYVPRSNQSEQPQARRAYNTGKQQSVYFFLLAIKANSIGDGKDVFFDENLCSGKNRGILRRRTRPVVPALRLRRLGLVVRDQLQHIYLH